MAYFLVGTDALNNVDFHHNGQLILCDMTDNCREIKPITRPTMGFALFPQFSPGEGEFMLLATGLYIPSEWIILDVETGEEPEL